MDIHLRGGPHLEHVLSLLESELVDDELGRAMTGGVGLPEFLHDLLNTETLSHE